MLERYRILKELLHTTSALSGAPFFVAAANALVRELGADFAFIARLEGEHAVHVLASCRQGQVREDWEFELAGTPCSMLYGEGAPGDWDTGTVGGAVSVHGDVLRRFESMRDGAFAAFVGVPLFAPDRSHAGHIALFFANPWQAAGQRGTVVELVELFSGQVQAELNRMTVERERARVLRELELANRRLQLETITDHLTGLHNRRHFAERVQEAFAGFARGHCPYGLLLLDLDRFKQINDQYGHAAGDDVLRAVAAALRAHCRAAAEPLFRIGGEEFAVLCFGALTEAALRAVGERLNAAVRGIALAGMPGLRPSVSVGATLPDPADTSWSAVYRRADAAMYAAKAAGRDRTVVELDASAQK